MRVLFVQADVSQTDEPVYALLDQYEPKQFAVCYFNDYGFRRKAQDPELGVIPVFPELTTSMTKIWVDSRKSTWFALLLRIKSIAPAGVVLCDLPVLPRQLLALLLRICGIKVGLRSDKNCLSAGSRRGFLLGLERTITHRSYNFLAPVSPLTKDYYDWPDKKPVIPFPYPSLDYYAAIAESKEVRYKARDSLGIEKNAFVFLAVVKFVERENPAAIIRAFERVATNTERAHLLVVGSGVLFESQRKYVADRRIRNISMVGYIPFAELRTHVAASDVLVHLARLEPWGVSVQDALAAGLGVIAGKQVGAANQFLQGALSQFLVDCEDIPRIAELMLSLMAKSSVTEMFRGAREKVLDQYTCTAVARRWATAWPSP